MVLDVVRKTQETRAAPQSVVWRTFLRGLAVELDAQAGADGSKAILRGVGQQMARLQPVISVASLEALEVEMNVVLAEIGWGQVQVKHMEADRCVLLVHIGLLVVGSAGEPAGTWLAPVLEGLYQGWMGQQPGAEGPLRVQIESYEDESIIFRYGR
jgi:hypothetical protein